MRIIFHFVKNHYVWLILIIALAFYVRLYRIENQIADWHSWRQADTASVARNFYQEGYNPFIPKYDDMSGVAENPVPNYERYRFVEFPIYPSLVYLGYLLTGGVDVKVARFIAILFSLGSLIFVYLVARKYFGMLVGIISALFYAILPFNVYFSRVVLPEPSLVFFCLGMFYFTDKWITKPNSANFFLSTIFAVLAFLTKPFAIFYLLPLIYPYFLKEKTFWPIKKRYILWALCTFTPFILWRFWISQHPEGIPASNWLFNGTHIRFRPAFFKWILGDRFGREILGVAGSFLFFIGLLIRPLKYESVFLHLLGLSSFLYLIIVATGNVQHDYYQYLIIPAVCIFTARGFVLLLRGTDFFIPRLITIPLALLSLVMTIYLPFNEVKGLYQINNGVILEAGKVADNLLPKDAVVLAPYNGDTSLLYAINRPGLPYEYKPIDDLIEDFGITHLVSTTKDPKTAWAMKKYTVLLEDDKYYIVDLTKINPGYDALIDGEEPK
jgi:4-amino-4-deoxy-L-arabinose transferase-like glycosyltransferase